MGSGSSELRRTLLLAGMILGTLLSVIPFVLRVITFPLVRGAHRRRIRELMERGKVPVDEPEPGEGSPRVYVIAGEASGDLHAANLIAALKEARPGCEVRGMGGPRMAAAGCRLDHDLVENSVMGFWPVLRSAATFVGLFRRVLRMLDTDPPDVLVPVDYPGFNLRAARAARKRGVRVVYYIAPQVWAWAPWRLPRIAASVDRLLAILPFEKELFARGGAACSFVGHPLYESLEQEAPAAAADRGEPKTVGLLPGSRRSEVRGVLPSMLAAARTVARAHPGLRWVLPLGRASIRDEVERILARAGGDPEVHLLEGGTPAAMREMDLALVTSGTATLELAYYGVPMVVLYRVPFLTHLLTRGLLLITPKIALVNIVGGGEVVPELIGPGDYSERAAEILLTWVEDPAKREETRAGLGKVRERLLFEGVARRAAGFVLEG